MTVTRKTATKSTVTNSSVTSCRKPSKLLLPFFYLKHFIFSVFLIKKAKISRIRLIFTVAFFFTFFKVRCGKVKSGLVGLSHLDFLVGFYFP